MSNNVVHYFLGFGQRKNTPLKKNVLVLWPFLYTRLKIFEWSPVILSVDWDARSKLIFVFDEL